jgi:hypothetical protein
MIKAVISLRDGLQSPTAPPKLFWSLRNSAGAAIVNVVELEAQEVHMRLGLIGFGALVAIMTAGVVQPSSAAPRPWCMQEPGYMGSCSYYSFQQCYESAKGLGGHCYENPAIAWQRLQGSGTEAPRRKARVRRE